MNWIKEYKKNYPGCKKYNNNGLLNESSMNGGCTCNHCENMLKSWVNSLNKDEGLKST
jgi:hypothetical protein